MVENKTPGQLFHEFMLSDAGRELRHRAMNYDYHGEDADIRQKYDEFAAEIRADLVAENERLTNAHAEVSKRYRRSLALLKRAYKAFNRPAWAEGEADSEVTSDICDLFAEEMLEKEILSKGLENES